MNPGKTPWAEIPIDTYQAARQVYNPSHIYLRIGDRAEELFAGIDLQRCGPFTHQDNETLSRISMVTAFQYTERLPDIVASDATRKRVDWKYALHLPVHHQGIAPQALCAFRQGMYRSQPAHQEYSRLLERLGALGLYPGTLHDPVTSCCVLETVCWITRLNHLQTGMKDVLSLLASIATDWVKATIPPYWYERYKTGQLRSPADLTLQDMQEEAEKIGADMRFLLAALRQHPPARYSDQEEIQHIRRLLVDQFTTPDGQVQWRLPGCGGCPNHSFKESLA